MLSSVSLASAGAVEDKGDIDDKFAAQCGNLPGGGVLVAVSGGSDSTALLILTYRHLAQKRPVRAATVDHGLRADSGAEASDVAALCERLDIPHTTLRWAPGKEKDRLSERARQARYHLLTRHAAELGITTILLGHTRDDQAETVFMRALRGGGTLGLSGMAPLTHVQNFGSGVGANRRLYGTAAELVRPLLDHSRAELRRWLAAERIGYLDDPTNTDFAYERPRARRVLCDGAAGFHVEEVLRFARLCGRHRSLIMSELATFLRANLSCSKTGLWTLRVPKTPVVRSVLLMALRVLTSVVGGKTYLSSEYDLQPFLNSVASGKAGKTTLLRSVLQYEEDRIFIWRERRNLPSSPLEPGTTIVWDGRYAICLKMGELPGVVSALGEKGVALLEKVNGKRFARMEREALQSQPGFWRGDTLLGVPHFCFPDSRNRIGWMPLYGALQTFRADSDDPVFKAMMAIRVPAPNPD